MKRGHPEQKPRHREGRWRWVGWLAASAIVVGGGFWLAGERMEKNDTDFSVKMPSRPVQRVARPQIQDESLRTHDTARAEAAALTTEPVARPRVVIHDGLELPAAAVAPQEKWNFTARQQAKYAQLGSDFLTTTEIAGVDGPAGAREQGAQWTAAVKASNERFELFFGTEKLSEQQLHAASDDPRH
jgi:hypothetical protein